MVQAREIPQEVESTRVAQAERVVQAHLEVGMRVERSQGGVQSGRVDVVNQQAHAHAAPGSLP